MNPSGRAWVVAGLPLAAVLAVDPSGLSPFGPLKWALVATLCLAAVAVLPGRGRRLALARASVVPWAVLLGIVAVAAATGVDPLYAWIGTPERRFGALTWLLCALAFVAGQQLDEDDSRFVAGAAVAVCAVTGVWVAAEELGWDAVGLAGAGARPVGPLGSSAYLGAAAALLTPACVGIAVDPRWRRPARRAATVAAAGGAVALVLSGARAAWVGTAVAAGVVVVVRRSALRRHRRLAAGLAGAALAVVGLGLLTGAAGRMADAATDAGGGPRDRLDDWRVAVRAVADDPVTGAGPEGYRIAFARAVDDDYEQDHGREPLPDRAHSSVLDVAATLGLPGLAALVVVLAGAGRFVRRALRTGPGWVAGVAAGLVAYAVQSLFLFPVAELDPVAWLLAGLVVSRSIRPEERLTLRPARAAPALAGALAGVALVAGVLDVAADRSARATLAAVARDQPVRDPAAAARLRPDALRYRLVAARAEEASAEPGAERRALAQLARALDLSPRDPVAGAERARLLLNRARRTESPAHVDKARSALEALVRRDPRNAQTLLRLGLARQLDRDGRGAERAWLAAERLAPRSPAASTYLALAYARAGRWDEARAAARRALARDPSDQRARAVMDEADGT
ncbi:MAG: O-antigen ligase family protein [Actinomycetota bacterium]